MTSGDDGALGPDGGPPPPPPPQGRPGRGIPPYGLPAPAEPSADADPPSRAGGGAPPPGPYGPPPGEPGAYGPPDRRPPWPGPASPYPPQVPPGQWPGQAGGPYGPGPQQGTQQGPQSFEPGPQQGWPGQGTPWGGTPQGPAGGGGQWPPQGDWQSGTPPQGGWQGATPPQGGWQGGTPPQGGWQGGTPPHGGWQGATPPPPELWQMPTQPSPPRRRGWVTPVVAVVAVVAVLAVAGGTFAFMSARGGGGPVVPTGVVAASHSAAASPAAANANADVCVMLDPDQAERLVPNAKITSSTDDNRNDTLVSYIRWSCGWANHDISYKDVTRSREITVNVSRYQALGTTTADKAARIQFDGEYKQYRYNATVSNKEHYYSAPQQFTGIGDQAAAQYQWTRESDKYWYSFGQGVGRVGDVVFQVKYQAGQQNKEADVFSADTVQSITEANALREVKGLLGQLARSVDAWRAGRPLPYHARPKPSPTPSPSPTRIPLPERCVALRALAATLVPKTEGAAARGREGGATVTQCQWWNDAMPIAQGRVRWRNLRIAIHEFADADSARYYLIDQRSKTKFTANGGIGGIHWGRVDKLPGFGQDAYGQAIRQRTDTAQSNRYEIYAWSGKTVIWVLLGGSDRPAGTPINAAGSVLMDQKEATAGAKSVAKALLGQL
ncbi:hypothetical protein GCM10009530_13120 [Microbispora corallina]